MRMVTRWCTGSVTVLAITASLASTRVEAQSVGPNAEIGASNACVQCSNNRHALIVGYDDLIGPVHECVGPECPGPHSRCGTYGFHSLDEVGTLVLGIAKAREDSLPHLLARSCQ